MRGKSSFLRLFRPWLLLLALGATATAGETSRLVDELAPRIQRGMEATIRNDFDAALVIFRAISSEYPEHPLGYFYQGAALQAQMLDAEDYRGMPAFEQAMQKTVQLSRQRQQHESDPWLLFLEGSAWLYTSFMDSKQGSLWDAWRHARRGVGLLEKVIEMDSTLYDAWLGVGSFKYWKSSKARSLTWLPFIDDERERGISMVRQACRRGRFVQLVGADQLAWILLDAGAADEALELARTNHLRFPESRFFRWTLVNVYYRKDMLAEAEGLYAGLLADLRAIPQNNHYNEITCLWRLAEIAGGRGDFEQVVAYTGQIAALQLSEEVERRTGEKRREAAVWQRQARTRLAMKQGNPPSLEHGGSR